MQTEDIGRIGAHQEFVKAAFKQALDHGIVDVAKVAFDEIESDITLDMIFKNCGKGCKSVPRTYIPVGSWAAPARQMARRTGM